MDDSIRIARELVRLAKILSASGTDHDADIDFLKNSGFSVDIKSNPRPGEYKIYAVKTSRVGTSANRLFIGLGNAGKWNGSLTMHWLGWGDYDVFGFDTARQAHDALMEKAETDLKNEYNDRISRVRAMFR